MLADVYGCPVKTIASAEGPAFDAAILAGVGAGIYPTVADGCSVAVHVGKAQEPDSKRSAAYESFYQLYLSLYPALKDSFHCLAKIK